MAAGYALARPVSHALVWEGHGSQHSLELVSGVKNQHYCLLERQIKQGQYIVVCANDRPGSSAGVNQHHSIAGPELH